MAKKDIAMSDAEIAQFLAAPHTLIVTSIDRDGIPHIAPMWYVVEDGKIVFRSFTKSQKIVNLRRNSKIAALVEDGTSYGELRGVMIRGTARLIADAAYCLDLYGKLAARYGMIGGSPRQLSPEELEAAFGRYAAKNTAVVIEPERIASWDHRKLSGGY